MPNEWSSIEEDNQCSSMALGGDIITVSNKTWQPGHWKKKAQDDAILWIKTMFPAEECSSLVHSRDHYNEEKQKGEFLQRLFLVLYSAPLKFSPIERANKKGEMQIWQYPLAMALSHGGRILFRIKGIEAKKFLNWVLTGRMDNIHCTP